MRCVIAVSVLVLLLACVCDGTLWMHGFKRELLDKNLGSGLEGGGLWSMKKAVLAAAAAKMLGKKEGMLDAKQGLFELFTPAADRGDSETRQPGDYPPLPPYPGAGGYGNGGGFQPGYGNGGGFQPGYGNGGGFQPGYGNRGGSQPGFGNGGGSRPGNGGGSRPGNGGGSRPGNRNGGGSQPGYGNGGGSRPGNGNGGGSLPGYGAPQGEAGGYRERAEGNGRGASTPGEFNEELRRDNKIDRSLSDLFQKRS